jgi:beta-phosphoglucomutase family hydrolase
MPAHQALTVVAGEGTPAPPSPIEGEGVITGSALELSPLRGRSGWGEVRGIARWVCAMEAAASGNDPSASRPGRDLRAWLLDLDGVITDTAAVHSRAWKRLFDDFLAAREGDPEQPFRLPEDYLRYVDGKPRYEGVRSFLHSRGIDLPWGDADDPPGAPTICGLGNRKNAIFNEVLDEQGVAVFGGTVDLIRGLRARGIKIACVTSSKNGRPVLERAGLIELFDAIVDGNELERHDLRGKPQPDSFLHAAALLEVGPGEAAVVEDALAGVEAGRAGGFGLVIGVDRGAGRAALLGAGADVVVDQLDERQLRTLDLERSRRPGSS